MTETEETRLIIVTVDPLRASLNEVLEIKLQFASRFSCK